MKTDPAVGGKDYELHLSEESYFNRQLNFIERRKILDSRVQRTVVRFIFGRGSQSSHTLVALKSIVIPAKRSVSRDPGFPPFSGSRLRAGMTMECVANAVRRWRIPFASTVSLSGIFI
jgi:hypothetical protein